MRGSRLPVAGLLLVSAWFGSLAFAGAGIKPVVIQEDFESGRAAGWVPINPADWKVIDEGGNKVYCLEKPGEQTGPVRKPGAYSIYQGRSFTSFTLTAKVKCLSPADVAGRDVVVVFGYRDNTHFYYVHFSNKSDRVHNRILIVNGADRAPIGPETTIPRLKKVKYYRIKVHRHVESGLIEVYVDDMDWPVMTAVDKTFSSGKIGVGSFDDTACFDDIRVVGLPAE